MNDNIATMNIDDSVFFIYEITFHLPRQRHGIFNIYTHANVTLIHVEQGHDQYPELRPDTLSNINPFKASCSVDIKVLDICCPFKGLVGSSSSCC